MAKRNSSSRRWLKEHFDDPFVKRAQAEGWRSRAIYKLKEIQEKDKILRNNSVLVDLGAAPGGWSQYASTICGEHGKVIALDILPMDGLGGVDFIQGDFTEDAVYQQLLTHLAGRKVDVVLSDMAPNASGQVAVDQPKMMYLAELALDFALQTLHGQGTFLIKLFQGEGFDVYWQTFKKAFVSTKTRKPGASRARSREVYLLGQGLRK